MQEQTSSNSLGERVPKLRFPEFEGEWVCEKLSDFTERVTRKNTNNETELPLTISSKDGLVDQISYFNKTVASKDMSGYYLLKHGEYAYNKSYSVGYSFGSIKRLDRYAMGALSTLYICFTLKKHNTDFVNTYFDSLKWYHEIHMISAEGARNHGLLNVPTEIFFETKHWLPINLDEQEKIAKFFQLLEYRIEIQQKLLDALKLYKRGLLSKLFPQKGERVPQYRFEGFTDAWEQRNFIECFDYLQNNSLSRAELSNENGEILNVHYGDILVKFGEVIDLELEELPSLLDNSILEKYINSVLQDGDIVIADAAEDETVGKCSEIMGCNGRKILAGLHTIPVRPREKYAIGYLGYYMNSKAYHNQLLPLMQGTKVSSISKTSIQDTIIIYPIHKEEQKKIGDYFAKLDNLITLHQKKYNFYEKEKLTLLQQMFI